MNNPTIDGVSRDTIQRAIDVIQQVGYQDKFIDYDLTRNVQIELRALLDTPAVEQQEVVQMASMPVERCYDVRAKMIIAFNEAKKAGGDLDDALDAAYRSALRFSPAPQDFADQQSTIARLEARITQLESEKEFAAATYQAARDRIAELESGRGEPIYEQRYGGGWINIGREEYERCLADPEEASSLRIVFAAPPAPVAVVLPERDAFEQLIIKRDGAIWVTVFGEVRSYNEPIERDYAVWQACLDATAALNGPAK